jgi:hypothetical protein
VLWTTVTVRETVSIARSTSFDVRSMRTRPGEKVHSVA